MVAVEAEYPYALGDEVVVNLAGVAVFDVDAAAPVPGSSLPDWIIGVVRGSGAASAGARYVITYSHHGRRCVAIVPARAIEGTA
ncbi:MAG TPA: hypothetical protein VIH21_07005 [Dehalococcoidia bacterium]|jgi:hypothetical protein